MTYGIRDTEKWCENLLKCDKFMAENKVIHIKEAEIGIGRLYPRKKSIQMDCSLN